MVEKAAGAFRTIGELAADLGVQQHILRYWETRFPQLRPLTRAGNRRYYRPEDVALARRIHHLLNEQGYTIKGVQRVLAGKAVAADAPAAPSAAPAAPVMAAAPSAPALPAGILPELRAIRDRLAGALAADRQG